MECEHRETCECHQEDGKKGGHWKHHEAMKAHLEGHDCCGGGGHSHAYMSHTYQAKGESLEELEARLKRLQAETLDVQEHIAKLKDG